MCYRNWELLVAFGLVASLGHNLASAQSDGEAISPVVITPLSGEASPSPAIPGMTPKLKWSQDYPTALKQAEKEKKPLLIDFTTDWCGWSKKMDREVISEADVQKTLNKYILVRVNPERSDDNNKVAERFGVSGFPHFVIANYKGEDIGQLEGYAEKKEFLEFIEKYPKFFENNPLGYKAAELPSADPLFAAIKKIPAPDARPTSAGSFIVLDQSTVRIETNGVTKLITRISTFVNDPDKQRDLPNAALYYNSAREKAKFKTVRVLGLNGRGREVDTSLAKDEHAYSNQNVYWDVRELSLDLPQLKAGQILDVIEEREQQPVMPGQFYLHWNTGTRILLSSLVDLTFPTSLKLQKQMVRCPEPLEEKTNADGTLTWTLKTSNPEADEFILFAPPYHETWEGCDFYTTCTKDDISRWFTDLCKGRDQLNAAAKKRISEIKKNNKTQTAQLQAIMDWVSKDIHYVSVLFGMSSHQPHPASETLINNYGDCKDQSMLVVALCREAGIPAAMVLVDAFGSGFNETNPAIAMFNHCIVEAKADGQTYYLDPAAGESKLGKIPQSYANTKALKIDGDKGIVVKLPPFHPEPDQFMTDMTVKLNPNGSTTVTSIARYSGEAAQAKREEMKNTTQEKIRSYIQDSYKRTGRKLIDFYMTDPTADGNAFEMRISYTLPRFGSMTAGGIAFKMKNSGDDGEWISQLNLPRTQKFRFYARDNGINRFSMELPPGAVLKARAEDLKISTPFLEASRLVTFTNNLLSVTEKNASLDIELPASEAGQIYAAFQKLQDHRDYSFIVQLPTKTSETTQ